MSIYILWYQYLILLRMQFYILWYLYMYNNNVTGVAACRQATTQTHVHDPTTTITCKTCIVYCCDYTVLIFIILFYTWIKNPLYYGLNILCTVAQILYIESFFCWYVCVGLMMTVNN